MSPVSSDRLNVEMFLLCDDRRLYGCCDSETDGAANLAHSVYEGASEGLVGAGERFGREEGQSWVFGASLVV